MTPLAPHLPCVTPAEQARVDNFGNDWIGLSDAARRMNVHRKTLEEWAACGRFPMVRLHEGGPMLLPASWVNRAALALDMARDGVAVEVPA